MKNFYLVMVVLFFAVILSGCGLTQESKETVAGKQELTRKSEDLDQSGSLAQPIAPTQINFSKRGTILNWDSRTESYVDEWTFLYDEPGALALNVKLIFNENSICNLGKVDQVCDESKLSNGSTTSVEGFEDGGKVIVTKLNYSQGGLQ